MSFLGFFRILPFFFITPPSNPFLNMTNLNITVVTQSLVDEYGGFLAS